MPLLLILLLVLLAVPVPKIFFGLGKEEAFLARTAIANQSIPSLSPSPCLAEQP